MRSMSGSRGKPPKGYQRSDDRLRELICERLMEDGRIDASEVEIEVQGGRVTLNGSVDSRMAKYQIEDVIEQFGVDDVQNNLRVSRGESGSMSSSTSGSPGVGSTPASGATKGSKSNQ
jgi:osmotically-inducible protein OsmY